MKLECYQEIFEKSSNFMKIYPTGDEYFNADRHDAPDSRFSSFRERS